MQLLQLAAELDGGSTSPNMSGMGLQTLLSIQHGTAQHMPAAQSLGQVHLADHPYCANHCESCARYMD